jgi:hypothetical protein
MNIDLLAPPGQAADIDTWHEGPPPSIGWWNATNASRYEREQHRCNDFAHFWRYWNGRYFTHGMEVDPGEIPRRENRTYYEQRGGPDGGTHPVVWRYRRPEWESQP